LIWTAGEISLEQLPEDLGHAVSAVQPGRDAALLSVIGADDTRYEVAQIPWPARGTARRQASPGRARGIRAGWVAALRSDPLLA